MRPIATMWRENQSKFKRYHFECVLFSYFIKYANDATLHDEVANLLHDTHYRSGVATDGFGAGASSTGFGVSATFSIFSEPSLLIPPTTLNPSAV